MAKAKVSKSKQKNIAINRIKTLFSEARKMHLFGREDLANRYVNLSRKLAMKIQSSIPMPEKREYCKNCHSHLLPGKNMRVRTSRGKVSILCLNCKHFLRVPYYKEQKEKRKMKINHTAKEVYVIRHANRDSGTGELTKTGIQRCKDLQNKFPKFDLIIASPQNRAIDTAKLLTASDVKIRKEADIPKFTKEQLDILEEKRKTHALGIAGVIFDNNELIPVATKAGKKLLSLIQESLESIKKGEKVLIISHDGTMVASEKILKKERLGKAKHTFHELEGFVVDENMNIKKIKL